MGNKVCGDKPMMNCSEIGDSCEIDEACCGADDGVKCQGGFCSVVPG